MRKVILKEESYNHLINEITYGMVDRAYERSYQLFDDLSTRFDEFYSSLNEALYNSEDGNPYLNQIKELADNIRDILIKKDSQRDKFNRETSKVDFRRFNRSSESDENDMDDLDLTYLQNNYPKH